MSFAKGIVSVFTVHKAFHFALGWLLHGALKVGDYFWWGREGCYNTNNNQQEGSICKTPRIEMHSQLPSYAYKIGY